MAVPGYGDKMIRTDKMKKIIPVICIIIYLLPMMAGCKKTDAPNDIKSENRTTCEVLFDSMTTEQKIAQMIIPDFRYYIDENGEFVEVTVINEKIEEILKEYSFGGIILFSQNIHDTEQTVRLIDSMQKANSSVPDRAQLLIATDQEGGIVSRVEMGTQFCGNMALCASDNIENATLAGSVMGEELAALGFNVDFAPVVDINSNPDNPVIGLRSFSDEAVTVGKYGIALMEGLQSQGITATFKHFPGHGDTDTDSHTGLPCIDKSYDELKENELIPFADCIENGAEMMITAHIRYPQIEKETYCSIKSGENITLPATFSKNIITDILRKDMGYEGVVITDAMNMYAVTENFDSLDSVRLAINAGVDMILMPVNTYTDEGIEELGEYVRYVAGMVDTGLISKENVDNSVMRILKLKESKGLLNTYDDSELVKKAEYAKTMVGSKEHHEKEWEITKKSITLVKNENNALPITDDVESTVIITTRNSLNLSVESAVSLLQADNKIPNKSTIKIISFEEADREKIKTEVKGAKHVLILSEVYSMDEMNPQKEEGEISKITEEIIDFVHENNATVAVISCNLPYDAARYQKADAVLAAWLPKGMKNEQRYEDGNPKIDVPNIVAAIYIAFQKDEEPQGKLPVNIPVIDENYTYSDEILYKRGSGIGYDE